MHPPSEKAQRADLLFARIATVAGTSIMYGAGPYLVPPSWHVPVLDWRDRTFRSDKVTAQDLEDFDIEIRDLYFWIRDELSHPRPPALANTDGEPIVMTTLTFELTTTLGDACEKLTSLATIDGDFHGEVNRDPSGVVTTATLNWTKAGNQRMRALPSTLLGTLRLDGGRLVAEVNSSERAKRLKDEIATRLGEAARLVETKITDLGEEIGDLPSGDDGTFAYPELAARIEAVTKQMADRHWDEWLDTPLPALRDQTPREAARSGGGRERLEALLAEFERRDLDGARNLFGVTPHLKDIRVKLGLTSPML